MASGCWKIVPIQISASTCYMSKKGLYLKPLSMLLLLKDVREAVLEACFVKYEDWSWGANRFGCEFSSSSSNVVHLFELRFSLATTWLLRSQLNLNHPQKMRATITISFNTWAKEVRNSHSLTLVNLFSAQHCRLCDNYQRLHLWHIKVDKTGQNDRFI